MFICPGSTTIYAEPVADQFIFIAYEIVFQLPSSFMAFY